MEAATNQLERPAAVPSPKVDPAAAGRAGGIASGEARRRKSEGRHWGDVLREAIQENPEQIVRNLLRSRNGAAIAVALQLVRDLERSKVHDLQNLDRETNRLDDLNCQLLDDIERDRETQAQLHAELDELWRQREELRAAIKAEADAAGFDLVEEPDEPDDEGGGDDAALAQTTAT